MWASSLSHNDLTGLGRKVNMPVHQIEHEISGMFPHVHHAAGLSAIFTSWALYTYKYNLPKFYKFAVLVFDINKDSNNVEEVAKKGILKLKDYFKSLDMPTTLNELNIDTNIETLKKLAYNYSFKKTRILPDFLPIGYEEALDILVLASK